MKNQFFLWLLLAYVLLVACDPKKEVQPDNEINQVNLRTSTDVLLYYYQMFDEFEKCNGSAYIYNFNTLATQSTNENDVFAVAEFYQNKPARIKDDNFNSFAINDYNFTKTDRGLFMLSNKNMNNLFGNSINLTFSNNQNTQLSNIYIPKKLQVFITPDLGGYNFEISSNTQIRWNKDEQNSQGVVLKIEYLPELNKQEIRQKFPKPILKFVGMQDTGEYQLTTEDIASLPSGADVSISVIRGVAKLDLFDNNNKSFMTIAYHEVYAGGIVK